MRRQFADLEDDNVRRSERIFLTAIRRQEAQAALPGGRPRREAPEGPQTRGRSAKAAAYPRGSFAALEPRFSLRRVRPRPTVPHSRRHR
jgi:hypothetical protein